MAFFEQLGKRISDAGQGVAQQTKNLADVTRLNSAISEKERRIAQLYQTLGKNYYERHRNLAADDEQGMVEQLDALHDEVARCREEIKQIKGVTKCAVCGADIPLHAAFCNACGAKVAEAGQQQERSQGPVCPACGQPVSRDNAFCIHCGTKLAGSEGNRESEREG